MSNPNGIFRYLVAGPIIIAGLLVLLFSCNKTAEPMPPPENTIFDTLFAKHTGVCFYYRKQLDTGAEQFDTTANSELDMTRIDSTWYNISGCATYNLVKHYYEDWDVNDTIVGYDYYQGSNHWSLEINLIERSIVAEHVYTPGGALYFERYKGIWEF
jgi:hypothetical protein